MNNITASNLSISSLAELMNEASILPVFEIDKEYVTEHVSSVGMKLDLSPVTALCIVYNPWDMDSILSAALLTTKLRGRRKLVTVSSDKVQSEMYSEYIWVGCTKAKATMRKDMFKKSGQSWFTGLFGKAKEETKLTNLGAEHVFVQKPPGQQATHIQESIYSLLLRKYNCATSVSNKVCDAIAGFYNTQSNMSLTKEQLVVLWSHYRLATVVLARSQQLHSSPGFNAPYVEIETPPAESTVHSWELTMRQIRFEMQGTVVRQRVNNGKRLIGANLTNWGTANYPWKARLMRMMDTPHVNYVFTPQGVMVDTNLPGLKIEEMMREVNVLNSSEI